MSFYLGDCLEVMKSLPARSVDCFICDLPYGQLAGGYDRPGDSENKKKKIANQTAANCSWDVKLNLEKFWEQVKRLCKDDHTPVIMFCNTKFGYELIKSNESWFRYDLVWAKDHGVSFLSANKMPLKSHEMIYVFSKKGAYYKRIDIKTDKGSWTQSGLVDAKQYGISNMYRSKEGGLNGDRCVLSVINIKKKTTRGGHPTEKPIDLYKWILERYCPKNGTALDPTAGSFNSMLAAKQLGLKAIGIEMDHTFYYKGIVKLIQSKPTNTIEFS